MKILVFDDSEIHRNSAKHFLKEHDVTIVSDWDTAMKKITPRFDAVLTDLLVPASDWRLGREGYKFIGEKMPLGTIFALYALSLGIKKVAIVTDVGHHDHPASAAFDYFEKEEYFKVGDARILCSNYYTMCSLDPLNNERLSRDFMLSNKGAEYENRKDLIWCKDWYRVLEILCQD